MTDAQQHPDQPRHAAPPQGVVQPAYGEDGRPHPQHGYGQQQFGAPQQQFGAPQQQFGAPQQQYGAPQQYGVQQYGQPGGYGLAMPPVPTQYAAPPMGPVGKIRGTGVVILLTIVTFGIYSLVYHYSVHEEMKRHSGEGLGGVIGLLLAIFFGFGSPFLLSGEVGNLYERHNKGKPVSAVTGLWVIPGFMIVIGPLVWFIKTNGALNAYWRSVGAR